jgi:hypothetical protein
MKAILISELRRILQRWLNSPEKGSFAAFVTQRGFYLIGEAVLDPNLVARLRAVPRDSRLDSPAETELMLAYLCAVEQLSVRWSISKARHDVWP